MNTSSAYILGTFNSAVFLKDKTAKILHADTGIISEIDGYIWSQLCAIKPEFKKVEFGSIDNLILQTNDESKKCEALELSLELMDPTLSGDYRLGISTILADLLNSDENLIPFILNRLYSTPVPEVFNEEQALKVLLPLFSKAGDFYKDLKVKTTFFSYFYTLFKLELELEQEAQDLVDQVLTDSGCYTKFTISLYEHSKKKYDSAIFESLKKLNELKISYSLNIFFEIEERLKTDYNIILKNKNSQFSANQKVDTINSITTDENDEIINLIESHFADKQEKHDFKINKRENSKKRKAKTADTLDIIENLIDWSKKYAHKSDDAFLHEFKDVVAKQLIVSKPEQLCKTCCDMASYFTQVNRYTLSKKLLIYARRLNSEDAVIYNQEAELYNKLGDLNTALYLYDATIQKFSKDRVAYCGKAETLRDMGKFAEALELYEQTIQKFSNDIIAHNGKAETLRDMGKFAEALNFYDKTIEKLGDDKVSYCGKAETLRDMGKFTEAHKLYEETIQKFGDDVIAYCGKAETLRDMNKFTEALKLYEETIQKFNGNVFACCGKAETLRDMGKFTEALKLYEETIQKFGDNVVAYCGKAETLRGMGKFIDTLNLYDKIIQEFGDNVVAYCGKAETLRDMGKFVDALKLYDETIQKFGDNIIAQNGKSETLRDLGEFIKALKLYDETIQKFGDDVVAYCGKAETLRDMCKFVDALKLYDETIQKFGDSSVAYCSKAETLRQMGKLTEALKLYDETIQKFSENSVAYCGKAETLRDMGKLTDALILYEKIIKKFEKNSFAQTSRLKLLLESNQLGSYINLLIKNKYETLDDYIDLHIYSVFLIKNGDWDEASNMINIGLKSPYFQNKRYFKGLALYLRILQKDYTLALSYFNSDELNKPIENLLATHAFAATNQIHKAKEVLHKLDTIELPVIKTTTSYLSERYSLNGYKNSGKTVDELDTLILEGEMKALLQS